MASSLGYIWWFSQRLAFCLQRSAQKDKAKQTDGQALLPKTVDFIGRDRIAKNTQTLHHDTYIITVIIIDKINITIKS